MDPNYFEKNIVDLTEQELHDLGFLGESVDEGIVEMVQEIRADPVNLGTITCFMMDCIKRTYQTPPPDAPTSPIGPTSPAISETGTALSWFSDNSSALTIVAPDLVSQFESIFWYHGLSGDPPGLLWRSDLESNPFPVPEPGMRFFEVPTKTAHGVFNTPLNDVWDTVAPQILASMKANGLRYSALQTVRFSALVDEEETFGPVVVWIAVPLNTKASAVHDATPDILSILSEAQITDVVVEWYEGSVERLVGPPLMIVEEDTSPKFGLNHAFNTGLGIPVATPDDDAQGTITFLFREVKTSNGDPSDRMLALTNKHVTSRDTTTPYEYDGTNPQYLLVCGERHFTRAIGEIEAAVNTGIRDAIKLSREVKQLTLRLGGQTSTALERKQTSLDYLKRDNAILQSLFAEVSAQWKDPAARRFGHVDWAPEISVKGVDNRNYTRDIATIEVDAAKLANFERNIVDLGKQYTASQLEDRFWPIATARKGKNIPSDLQLPIHSVVPRELVITPDTEDKNGEPLYIVGKYGNTTDLTLGRYSGMEAYTCTEYGLESREAVIYNYSKTSGDFSKRGDSGSLIFTGDGKALAILHSGMPRGMHNHVTYGTPIWWVVEQILKKYPSAEFCGITID